MSKYYVNKNPQVNGDHEVHEEGCFWMPKVENRIDLGFHYNCRSAVVKAKKHYKQSNGCKHCSIECHTS